MVEDDDGLRASALCTPGFSSAEFASAEKRWRPCERRRGVRVSGIGLPGKVGARTATELRARNVDSPLILITAYDNSGLREEASRRCAAYLIKPLLGTELLNAVRVASEPAAQQ